jgi:hypothetical protein
MCRCVTLREEHRLRPSEKGAEENTYLKGGGRKGDEMKEV